MDVQQLIPVLINSFRGNQEDINRSTELLMERIHDPSFANVLIEISMNPQLDLPLRRQAFILFNKCLSSNNDLIPSFVPYIISLWDQNDILSCLPDLINSTEIIAQTFFNKGQVESIFEIISKSKPVPSIILLSSIIDKSTKDQLETFRDSTLSLLDSIFSPSISTINDIRSQTAIKYMFNIIDTFITQSIISTSDIIQKLASWIMPFFQDTSYPHLTSISSHLLNVSLNNCYDKDIFIFCFPLFAGTCKACIEIGHQQSQNNFNNILAQIIQITNNYVTEINDLDETNRAAFIQQWLQFMPNFFHIFCEIFLKTAISLTEEEQQLFKDDFGSFIDCAHPSSFDHYSPRGVSLLHLKNICTLPDFLNEVFQMVQFLFTTGNPNDTYCALSIAATLQQQYKEFKEFLPEVKKVLTENPNSLLADASLSFLSTSNPDCPDIASSVLPLELQIVLSTEFNPIIRYDSTIAASFALFDLCSYNGGPGISVPPEPISEMIKFAFDFDQQTEDLSRAISKLTAAVPELFASAADEYIHRLIQIFIQFVEDDSLRSNVSILAGSIGKVLMLCKSPETFTDLIILIQNLMQNGSVANSLFEEFISMLNDIARYAPLETKGLSDIFPMVNNIISSEIGIELMEQFSAFIKAFSWRFSTSIKAEEIEVSLQYLKACMDEVFVEEGCESFGGIAIAFLVFLADFPGVKESFLDLVEENRDAVAQAVQSEWELAAAFFIFDPGYALSFEDSLSALIDVNDIEIERSEWLKAVANIAQAAIKNEIQISEESRHDIGNLLNDQIQAISREITPTYFPKEPLIQYLKTPIVQQYFFAQDE